MRDIERWDALLPRRLRLCRQYALKAFARLQAPPVGEDGRLELGREPEVIGEQQRIADRHVRSGEAVGAEELRSLEQGVQRAQPRQEPAGVVLDDLRLFALGGLVAPVTQDQGL